MVLRLESASDRNQLSPGSPVGVGIFTERRRRDLSLVCSGDCRGIWSVVVCLSDQGTMLAVRSGTQSRTFTH
jgi:hypothetical protein